MNDQAKRNAIFFIPAFRSCSDTAWIPPADVYSIPGGWLIKLDLAGVRTEDVSIALRGSAVLIEGVRRDLLSDERFNCQVLEITYSRFQRVIHLPASLDNAEIKMDYKDGILLIRVLNKEGVYK
jgi:HSP20 family protein